MIFIPEEEVSKLIVSILNRCFGGGVSISQGDSLRVYTFLFVA